VIRLGRSRVTRWLARRSLSSRTRHEYGRWVPLFCAWLDQGADEGADPLADLAARDYVARDFKRFSKAERALSAALVKSRSSEA
jgi:hypothetical protein